FDSVKVDEWKVTLDNANILRNCVQDFLPNPSHGLEATWTQDMHFFVIYEKVKVLVELEHFLLHDAQCIINPSNKTSFALEKSFELSSTPNCRETSVFTVDKARNITKDLGEVTHLTRVRWHVTGCMQILDRNGNVIFQWQIDVFLGCILFRRLILCEAILRLFHGLPGCVDHLNQYSLDAFIHRNQIKPLVFIFISAHCELNRLHVLEVEF